MLGEIESLKSELARGKHEAEELRTKCDTVKSERDDFWNGVLQKALDSANEEWEADAQRRLEELRESLSLEGYRATGSE